MEEIKKVLFICVHNSGRSQIAEAFINKLGKGKFKAESAGLEPKPVNPLVIEVMKESGFDLSSKKPNSVFDFFKQSRLYDFVITVCDESSDKQCPIFPGVAKRLHWPFPDPAELTGTHEEKLKKLRIIRDNIKDKIEKWIIDLKVQK